MSTGPYRTPDQLPDEGQPSARPFDLGARRSTHLRGGVIAGWPEVDVHDNGLVLRRQDFQRFELPFEEIDAIHYDYDGLIPGPPRVTLVSFDGVRTVLPNDLRELDRVLAELDRQVTRPITARAKEALASGERLVFGPLVLELDGLVLNGQNLEWAHLSRVDAERDSLVIYANEPRGRFGWVRLVDIPHPRALLDVLRLRTTVVMRGLPLIVM
jgi:hypothetical protein